MYIVKPNKNNEEDFFYAVAGTGSTVTVIRGGYYIIPESVYQVLKNKKIEVKTYQSAPSPSGDQFS